MFKSVKDFVVLNRLENNGLLASRVSTFAPGVSGANQVVASGTMIVNRCAKRMEVKAEGDQTQLSWNKNVGQSKEWSLLGFLGQTLSSYSKESKIIAS
jgi:hypothetical protein